MNKWGIPKEIEEQVRKRDKQCVYCGCAFSEVNRKEKASWEHIINDIRITAIDNIVFCCVACNASKGNKSLSIWLNSKYCQSKNITSESVADIIRVHLKKYSI